AHRKNNADDFHRWQMLLISNSSPNAFECHVIKIRLERELIASTALRAQPNAHGIGGRADRLTLERLPDPVRFSNRCPRNRSCAWIALLSRHVIANARAMIEIRRPGRSHPRKDSIRFKVAQAFDSLHKPAIDSFFPNSDYSREGIRLPFLNDMRMQ